MFFFQAGDYCATNKEFADLVQRTLIGCYSHRFHLAVGDILRDCQDVTDNVSRNMIKLRNLITAA